MNPLIVIHDSRSPAGGLVTMATRTWLETVDLPAASRQALKVALGQIDELQATIEPIDSWLRALARRQPGYRALLPRHFGIGAVPRSPSGRAG